MARVPPDTDAPTTWSPRPVAAVLFDMDGTLVVSDAAVERACRASARAAVTR